MHPQNLPVTSAEMLSAFADGQAVGDELFEALHVRPDAEALLGRWSHYHLIQEALHNAELDIPQSDAVFLQRFRLRLAQLGPVQAIVHKPVATAKPSRLRWKVVAGLASLGALALITWHALSWQAPDPQTVVLYSSEGALLPDARLQELLWAHRQLGNGSALQVPAGFLRHATFETPSSTPNTNP